MKSVLANIEYGVESVLVQCRNFAEDNKHILTNIAVGRRVKDVGAYFIDRAEHTLAAQCSQGRKRIPFPLID